MCCLTLNTPLFCCRRAFDSLQDMSWSFDVGPNPLPLGRASLLCRVLLYIENAADLLLRLYSLQDMSWSFDVEPNPLPPGRASLLCHVLLYPKHAVDLLPTTVSRLLHLCRTCLGRLMWDQTRCRRGM
jgi:hypothetical protein